MTQYVHGYGTPEQERLVEQAQHWRHRLIRDGTQLDPGTRLLEVGTGAGAVLAVLGQEFPGVSLTGVDIEPKQLEFARSHLERSGVEATLVQADALALPFGDESFDHVWMMWFLEHVADPPATLRELGAPRDGRRQHGDRGRLPQLDAPGRHRGRRTNRVFRLGAHAGVSGRRGRSAFLRAPAAECTEAALSQDLAGGVEAGRAHHAAAGVGSSAA